VVLKFYDWPNFTNMFFIHTVWKKHTEPFTAYIAQMSNNCLRQKVCGHQQ